MFSNVWRLGLSGLSREITQMKDVILITTCRSSFRTAIWPGETVENASYMYGLDEYDIETAMEKYFAWYKIKADLTAVSLSQFKRPIYLKIFCESKNHARQEEKHIYIGEQTLFEVFDEYLKQCNQAVCSRLGLHASATVALYGLQKAAAYIWQQRTRNIPLARLAHAIDGQPLETLNWQSSRTKTILDEGLLVCRDWSNDQDVVYFTYDLLGGYLIARYLLEGDNAEVIAFIQSEVANAKLFSTDFQALHPMYSDIRRCLAALLPVKIGHYLHEISDNSIAFDVSINALFEILPNNIGQGCVDVIARLFKYPENRKRLLELAASTAGNIYHPLNASFWSKQIEELSMPERDVSWTEHIRENPEQFEKLLARFEAACQSSEPFSEMMTHRSRLLAEHIMWMLTSTVRPLRDKATRALYWYGHRFPSDFLDLALGSLKINNPYVPERMLAAIYGIAMARQYDFGHPGFSSDNLPVYGRKLYDAMFAPNAPHATTHVLARDYARYTIEISLIHHPNLLTGEEQQRITPPFADGGIREWGQSEDINKDEYRYGNAPIQMDFGNYTLGRLVKDRSNYDYDHEEYQVVRSNIFWRIYELGYSLEVFGNIDQRIADENWRYGRSEDGSKTDRYGKKYSWIAFYELAGFRRDQGLLDDRYDTRISDADIDPSSPSECQQYELVRHDFLGNRDMPVEEWILHGGLPDLEPYLIVNALMGEQGPWILLDGYINQEDNESTRGRFIFPRGFIVKSGEAAQVVARLQQQNLGGRWLPEISEDYYTYAGEIPWCATYPNNGVTEIGFGANEHEIFAIFLPVRDNNWESYHSTIVPGRHVSTPAKEIAEKLDLCGQPQTFDLFDKNGTRASITFCYGESWHTSRRLRICVRIYLTGI